MVDFPVYGIVLIAIAAFLILFFLYVRCCVSQIIACVLWCGKKRAKLTDKEIQAGEEIFDWSYCEGGDKRRQTVVIVHGFSANKESMTRLARDLVGNYHVIVPDLTGHGKTYPIEKDGLFTVDAQVDRLKQFLDAVVGPDAKYHMAGTSMGGWITGLFSHRYQESILSATLICPAGVNPEETSSEEKEDLNSARASLLAQTPDDLRAMMKSVSVKPIRIPDFVAKQVLKERNATGVLKKIMTDLRYDTEKSLLSPERLQDITIPMFVIWGDKDKILDYRGIDCFTRDVSHVETRIVQNCGHAMLIDAPNETCDAVKEFIDRIGSHSGDKPKLKDVVVEEKAALQEPLLENEDDRKSKTD